MGPTLAIIYFGGLFGSIIVHRTRAGVPFFAVMGFGQIGWLFVHTLKAIFWPVVLVMCFVNGRPGPRVVFGRKAMLMHQHEQLQRKAEEEKRAADLGLL